MVFSLLLVSWRHNYNYYTNTIGYHDPFITHSWLLLLQVALNKTFVKYSFQNIDIVHTYNVYDGIESFHSYPNILQAFRGRGKPHFIFIK